MRPHGKGCRGRPGCRGDQGDFPSITSTTLTPSTTSALHVDRLPDARADRPQLLLLLSVRLEDVAEQGARRAVIDRDRLRREPLAAEVALRVEADGMAEDDVLVSILHAHGDEPLAGLLHEAEAHAVGGLRPRLREVAIAIVTLVLASVRAQRAKVALVTAFVSNDVLHDSSFGGNASGRPARPRPIPHPRSRREWRRERARHAARIARARAGSSRAARSPLP